MLILAVLCGCRQGGGTPESEVSPEEMLDDAARAELHLPAEDELTLVTDADIQFAKTLDPDVSVAVEHYVKQYTAKFRIDAARRVGDYLLLWVSFPEVMDGGVDLIYSVEKGKIVGTFFGGYRG